MSCEGKLCVVDENPNTGSESTGEEGASNNEGGEAGSVGEEGNEEGNGEGTIVSEEGGGYVPGSGFVNVPTDQGDNTTPVATTTSDGGCSQSKGPGGTAPLWILMVLLAWRWAPLTQRLFL
jgi:hypothetical protein